MTMYDRDTCIPGAESVSLLEKSNLSHDNAVMAATEEEYEDFSHLFYTSHLYNDNGIDGTDSLSYQSSDFLVPVNGDYSTSLEFSNNEEVHPNNNDIENSNPYQDCDNATDNTKIFDRELVAEICTDLLTNSLLQSPILNEESVPAGPKTESAKPIFINNTPEKDKMKNVDQVLSPELFSDDETKDRDNYINVSLSCDTKVVDEKYVHKNDKRLLRRVREGISGVLPPPSFTTVNYTVSELLEKIKNGKEYFVQECDVPKAIEQNSETSLNSEMTSQDTSNSCSIDQRKKTLLISTDLEGCLSSKWPWVLEQRYHGLHYNRGKVCEEFELLCAKYGQRYISAETQSTCTVFDTNRNSPSKRRASQLRWMSKSPGRRLSHLAKRRITFSSQSLQSGSSGLFSHSRKILVDSRKMQMLARRKSPRKAARKSPRKTPRRSPRKRIRTPISSGKSQIVKSLHLFSEEDQQDIKPSTSATRVHATKRALFQSPEGNKAGPSNSKLFLPSTSGTGSTSPFVKKDNIKKALISSPRKSPKKSPYKRNLFDNKRKRTESGNELHPAKMPRKLSVASIDSENEVPSASKTRALFSVSKTSSHNGELSAHHKKKLQWAVYEALKCQNIGISNPNFKSFASTLARVTRRFLPNLSANVPRPEGGTSERMLRIARQHVFSVIKGKTVDEIVQEVQRNRLKTMKPSGYISIEQANAMNREHNSTRSRDTVLQDKANIINSIDKNSLSSTKDGVNKVPRFESKIDRVRKVINFDDDSHNNLR